MKYLVIPIFALVAASAPAFASLSINDSVAADLVIRQIVDQKLLPKTQEAAYVELNDVLSGSTSTSVVEFSCDAILGGRDACDLRVVSKSEDTQDDDGVYSFVISVIVEGGKVTSASLTSSEG